MALADELEKLQRMHQTGALSDDEFARAKAALLEGGQVTATPPARAQWTETAPASVEQQTRQWAMFLHLSLLAGCLVPVAGLVLPIVLWQVKKAELPGIDPHGRAVVNWLLSAIIYGLICVPLIFVIIGIPLLIALAVLGIVFPIIGGIKASNGELWKYPLSIPFF
jgi:uncharacterized Tic20 family protein